MVTFLGSSSKLTHPETQTKDLDQSAYLWPQLFSGIKRGEEEGGGLDSRTWTSFSYISGARDWLIGAMQVPTGKPAWPEKQGDGSHRTRWHGYLGNETALCEAWQGRYRQPLPQDKGGNTNSFRHSGRALYPSTHLSTLTVSRGGSMAYQRRCQVLPSHPASPPEPWAPRWAPATHPWCSAQWRAQPGRGAALGLFKVLVWILGFPGGSAGKESTAMRETWVRSPGWEDPLEKGMATYSSILTWRIPWAVWSMGLPRVRHNWATFTFACLDTGVGTSGLAIHKCPYSPLSVPAAGLEAGV